MAKNKSSYSNEEVLQRAKLSYWENSPQYKKIVDYIAANPKQWFIDTALTNANNIIKGTINAFWSIAGTSSTLSDKQKAAIKAKYGTPTPTLEYLE